VHKDDSPRGNPFAGESPKFPCRFHHLFQKNRQVPHWSRRFDDSRIRWSAAFWTASHISSRTICAWSTHCPHVTWLWTNADRQLSACLCADERSRVGAGWPVSGDVNEQVESAVDYKFARQRRQIFQFDIQLAALISYAVGDDGRRTRSYQVQKLVTDVVVVVVVWTFHRVAKRAVPGFPFFCDCAFSSLNVRADGAVRSAAAMTRERANGRPAVAVT
jgi:hypothetical protein